METNSFEIPTLDLRMKSLDYANWVNYVLIYQSKKLFHEIIHIILK